MVRSGLLPVCFLLLTTAMAAAESRIPGSGGISFKPLVQPQLIEPPPPRTPYPLNYTDQVAQSLGVRDGGLSLTRPGANPYAPSVSFNGSMLRLKWRP